MTDNLRCNYCDKEFKYESEKKRHELSHNPHFQCDICNKKFSFNSALKRHVKQHQRTEKVQCKQCNRSFRDESLLKRHNKYAHKGKYTCVKCYAEFHSELALSTHQKIHNDKTKRKYQCSFEGCKKTFNFSHHLKHHEMTHSNIKQYYCLICKKGFIQSHHFKSHMKIHEIEKWLHCTQVNCKKRFPTEYSRKKHLLRVHNIKLDDMSSVKTEQPGSIQYEYDIESNTVLCTTCGNLVNLNVYEKHHSQCSLESNVSSGDLPETKLEALGILVTKEDVNPQLLDCKSALGGCIMNDDSSENCLCAQIKTTVDDYYDNTIIPAENVSFTNIQSKVQPFEPFNLVHNETIKSSCENCACNGNLQSNFGAAVCLNSSEQNIEKNNFSLNNNVKITFPDIEYKLDGSIKLKETFDADIDFFKNVKAENKENNKVNSYYVPFNSCKDVLGKCIVSGNGTISEECLCAKMLVDEQHATAEEIDEITPRPVVSTTILSVM